MTNYKKFRIKSSKLCDQLLVQQYQGKGIGKKATQLMLEKMAKLPNAQKIVVGYDTENIGAHNLYRSLGFVDHGDRFVKKWPLLSF